MKIKIAERLMPFSHTPGVFLPLPYTNLSFQIFPAQINVFESGSLKEQIPLGLTGPINDFTAQLDIEHNLIKVWGFSKEFFRYVIKPTVDHSWKLIAEKGCTSIHSERVELNPPQFLERLSLGNHKAQDWQMVKRRQDLTEIFPVWFSLGQLFNVSDKKIVKESLLAECLNSKDTQTFINFFNAGFDGILNPRAKDDDHLGFNLPPLAVEDHLLDSLRLGYEGIRKLFITEKDDQIFILNQVPPQFHCGRMLGIQLEKFGEMDIEWTKKQVRSVIIRAKKDCFVMINFHKDIRQYRVREEKQNKGLNFLNHLPLGIKKDKIYYLDKFQT